MSRESQVEGWLSERNEPPQAAMRHVREVIVAADPRISEYIKYGTPTFGYEKVPSNSRR